MGRQGLMVVVGAAVLLGAGIVGTIAFTEGDSGSGTMTMPDGSTMPASEMPTTESFDRAFIDAMVPHHESALAMAQEAKDAGLAEPELVAIADAILATQQAEIDQMKSWRQDWFGSSEIDPDGADELGMSMEDMGMTGDSAALAEAEDVDAAFASAMIAHHQGAVAMAELALDRSERPEIRELAQAIVDAQTDEIERMRPYAEEG